MLKDEELPAYLGEVLGKMTVRDWQAEAFPLILPLLCRGYEKQALDIFEACRVSGQMNEGWKHLLFNTLEQIVRLEAWPALLIWIQKLEQEIKADFSGPWRGAVLDSVIESGKLPKKGKKELNGFLSGRKAKELDPEKIFGKVFDLFQDKIYFPRLLSEYNYTDVDDRYDLIEMWTGSSGVYFAYDQYLDNYPTFEEVKYLTVIAGRLKDRGQNQAASRLEGLVKQLNKNILALQGSALDYKIKKAYGLKPMRLSNSFLDHLDRLEGQERDFLPLVSTLFKELVCLANMPESLGGGWPALLKYLNTIPASFIKTYLCKRLSEELLLLPDFTDNQIGEFRKDWKRSFDVTITRVVVNGFYEPDENGFMSRREFRGPAAAAIASRNLMFATASEATCHYFQSMSSISGGLAWDNFKKVVLNLRSVVLRHDPLGADPQPCDRSGKLKHILFLAHDPNFEPLKRQVEGACKRRDTKLLLKAFENVKVTVKKLPPLFQSRYIGLLLRISLKAYELKMERLSGNSYELAFELSKGVAQMKSFELSRHLFYVNASQKEKEFDLSSRFREIQASWERESLAYFARKYNSAGDMRTRWNISQEILKIADNESIFDMLESKDYRQAACALDRTGEQEELVIRLFERAVQCKIREQHENSFDLDWELINAIDASRLSTEERDGLLASYLTITIKRAVLARLEERARSSGEKENAANAFAQKSQRLLQPFHALLDVIEARGYLKSEGVIWEELCRLSDFVQLSYPAVIQPVILEALGRLSVCRNPALADPASRPALEKTTGIDAGKEELDDIFGAFGKGKKTDYANLPTLQQIQEGDPEQEVSLRILSYFPNDGENVDPHLLDLYRALYVSEQDSKIVECWTVQLAAKHFGFDDPGDFFRGCPGLASSMFLSHLNKFDARNRYQALLAMLNSDMPLEVKQGAFQALANSGLMSKYVRLKFEEIRDEGNEEQIGRFITSFKGAWVGEIVEESATNILLPDWVLAPLLEPVLEEDRPRLLKALAAKYDAEKTPEKAESLYDLIVFLCREYIENNLGIEKDPAFLHFRLLQDIRDLIKEGHIDISIKGYDLGDGLCEENLYYECLSAGQADRLLCGIFERNRMLVRANQVRLPGALKAVHPTLRLTIADYIALASPQTRLLILHSLSKAETDKGEAEVLKKFFEITGLEKLAQFLSVQKGVIPENYRRELESFQEDIKPGTLKEMQDTLRDTFGNNLLGRSFEPDSFEFVHAGTVGEIWKGRSKDGRVVALKVLPRRKRQKNTASIRVLKGLAADLNLFRHELFSGVDLEGLYAQYRETLMGEMDYCREVENYEKLRPSLERSGILSPQYINEHTRMNVLAMDFLELKPLAELKGRPEAQEVVNKTGEQLARAIFEEGLFYEDYHGGNIKWSPDKKLPVILDFGRIGELNNGQREALIGFLASAAQSLPEQVMQSLKDMTSNKWRWMEGDSGRVGDILAQNSKNSQKIQELFALVALKGGIFHPPYSQFLKAVISWEGAMGQIDTAADFSGFAAAEILRRLLKKT
ncbi:MAG: AarF/UbiB family protein [Candidatus Margulisiibacteriota bacterium]